MCSEGFPIEIKITNVTFQTNQSTHMYVANVWIVWLWHWQSFEYFGWSIYLTIDNFEMSCSLLIKGGPEYEHQTYFGWLMIYPCHLANIWSHDLLKEKMYYGY